MERHMLGRQRLRAGTYDDTERNQGQGLVQNTLPHNAVQTKPILSDCQKFSEQRKVSPKGLFFRQKKKL